jgi:hypothetical protein
MSWERYPGRSLGVPQRPWVGPAFHERSDRGSSPLAATTTGTDPAGSSTAEQSPDKRPMVVQLHPGGPDHGGRSSTAEHSAVNRAIGVRSSSITPARAWRNSSVSGFQPGGTGATPVVRTDAFVAQRRVHWSRTPGTWVRLPPKALLRCLSFLRGSTVEHPAVNRGGAGSTPAGGARSHRPVGEDAGLSSRKRRVQVPLATPSDRRTTAVPQRDRLETGVRLLPVAPIAGVAQRQSRL